MNRDLATFIISLAFIATALVLMYCKIMDAAIVWSGIMVVVGYWIRGGQEKAINKLNNKDK